MKKNLITALNICYDMKGIMVAEIWKDNILIIGKEFEIDFYHKQNNGSLEIYDNVGERVTCPSAELEYDQGEDVYFSSIGDNLTLRIYFLKKIKLGC